MVVPTATNAVIIKNPCRPNERQGFHLFRQYLIYTSPYQIYFYTLHTRPYSSHILSFPVKGVKDHIRSFALMQKSQKTIDFIGS